MLASTQPASQPLRSLNARLPIAATANASAAASSARTARDTATSRICPPVAGIRRTSRRRASTSGA